MIEIIPNWHPIFVHFSVTLLSLAGLLQVLAWAISPEPSSPIWFAKKWVILMGFVAIVITVATGIHAYSTVPHDAVSHMAMSEHRNWGIATGVTFLIGGLLSLLSNLTRISGIIIIVSSILMFTTAYKGGELVYRYGLGVMSLPNVEKSHHQAQSVLNGPTTDKRNLEKQVSEDIDDDAHHDKHDHDH